MLFYLVHTYKNALREKDNAVCFNSSHGETHWQGRENILPYIVTLSRNLREAEAAVTYTVVSSNAYDDDSSAGLAGVYVL